MSGYEIASLTEIESVKAVGTLRWTPLRKHFGITAFGISAYTAAEAGQDVVEEHTEETLGHEELYVVVAGRATFVLDGEEKDVPAGSVVFLRDPKVKRFARAEEPGTTVLAVGGKPGSHESPPGSTSSPHTASSTRIQTGRLPRSRLGWRRSRITRGCTSIWRASTVARAGSTRPGSRSTEPLSSIPRFRSGRMRTRTSSR